MTIQVQTSKPKVKVRTWALALLQCHTLHLFLLAPTAWKEDNVQMCFLYENCIIKLVEQKAKLKEQSESKDLVFLPLPLGKITIGRSSTSLNLEVLMGYMSLLTHDQFPLQDCLRIQ